MNKPRMPVHHLPPLPDVKELDAHGNDITDKPQKSQNQWAQQIIAQADAPAKVNVWARSEDVKPKPAVKLYAWEDFAR